MSLQLVKTFLAMANKEIPEGEGTCMFSILSELKEAGAELDREHRKDMDRVQEELIKLCQNREEDLEIRLMMLEILELRALGWRRDENSKKYYDKQFSIIRAAKEQAKSPTSPPSSQQNQTHPPSHLPEGPHSPLPSQQAESPQSLVSPPRERVERNREGKGSFIKEHLEIGNFQLVLKCSDKLVLQLSKQQLCSFFKSRNQININSSQEDPSVKINYLAAKPPPPPTFKYSREEILLISEDPQSKAQPVDWSEKRKKLPGAILKSRSSAI